MQINQLPDNAFLRLNQIVRVPGSANQPLLPISRTTFLVGIKKGHFPAPVKLGAKSVAWRVGDIRKLLAELGAGGAA